MNKRARPSRGRALSISSPTHRQAGKDIPVTTTISSQVTTFNASADDWTPEQAGQILAQVFCASFIARGGCTERAVEIACQMVRDAIGNAGRAS